MHVSSVKEFLLTEQHCPAEWRPFDLYLFRDDAVVFYVGQSYVAFDRVWRHILDGYKGRSVVGRFILCNWPASMRFTVELLSSRSQQFADLEHDLNAAERRLIERYAPCFNVSLNSQPTPLPACYAPPGQRITCPRSLTKLINQASMAVKADRRRTSTIWRYTIMANQDRAFTRPIDRSLEAYKAWLQNMVIRLGGETGALTDEEWEKLHAEFWSEAGNEEDAEQD